MSNETVWCPGCNIEIYMWFVVSNGKCPSCNIPLAVSGETVVAQRPQEGRLVAN